MDGDGPRGRDVAAKNFHLLETLCVLGALLQILIFPPPTAGSRGQIDSRPHAPCCDRSGRNGVVLRNTIAVAPSSRHEDGAKCGFTPALELKCRLDVFFDLKKVKHVRGDCFSIELVIEIPTTLSGNLRKPPIVPLLHEVVLDKFPNFCAKIEKPIVE